MKLNLCVAKKPCVMTSFPYKEIELDIKINFELKFEQNVGKSMFFKIGEIISLAPKNTAVNFIRYLYE